METVRKWGIHYSKADDPQEALSFLQLIEDKADCYSIDRDRLPTTMLELLRGQALDWYRNNKKNWQTWKSFVKSFTDFFVPKKMRAQIEDEISSYIQQPEQPIQDYILRIQSLMRFATRLSESEKLERIYNNCRKDYKMYVKRSEFKTLTEFKDLAETFENLCYTFQNKSHSSSNKRSNQHQKNNQSSSHYQNNNNNNHSSSYHQNNQYVRHEKTAAVTTENSTSPPAPAAVDAPRRNPFREGQSSMNTTDQGRTFQNTARPQYQCFNCDRMGHTARYCHQPTKPWCRRCKKRGVTTESCQCPNEEPVLEFCQHCRARVKNAANCECRKASGSQLPGSQPSRIPPAVNQPVSGQANTTLPAGNQLANGGQVMASENDPSSKVDSRPHVTVGLYDKDFNGLMDTGSTASYISEDVAEWLSSKKANKYFASSKIKLADGSVKDTSECYDVTLLILGKIVKHKFTVMPKLQVQVLIGDELLRKIGVRLTDSEGFEVGGPTIDDAGNNHVTAMQQVSSDKNESLVEVETAEVTDSCCVVSNLECEHSEETEGGLIERKDLTSAQESQLNALLERELKKFNSLTGCTNYAEHVITMKSDQPVKQRYFPKNPKMCEIIHKQVDELIANGQIEPSSSAYASPVVLVKKKDGTWRMCIDYRKLNEVSVKDAYPMPQIPSILNRLKEAKFVTALDLKNGYWQISIKSECRQFTAFTVPGRGLFQWRVMPFGLHSAPATFQRLLDTLVTLKYEKFAMAYLDDIIIFSKSFEEHLEHIEIILKVLQEANLKINQEKSVFCKKELKYLGHVVGNGGIKTDPDKVKAISELKAPTDVSGVRRVIGMAAWYSKFIKNFTSIVAPLHELLKKGQKFEWTTVHQEALDQLKEKMISAPIIACPDYTHPFVLQTDASNLGVGAVLYQIINGQERVVAYSSRKLNSAERNYTTTEKECLAVVWGIKKNIEYLEGIPFTVITDHIALKWIFKLPNPTGRLGRWVIELRNHDFDIQYKKGKLNVVPDALSREPLEIDENDLESIEFCSAISDESSGNCPWLSKKIAEVAARPEKFPEYFLDNGTLLKNCGFGNCGGERWNFCVPTNLRQKVLEENHEDVKAGHLGIRKTINRIGRKYYWPGMQRDIKRFVDKCVPCLEHKVPQTKPAGYMHTTPVTDPWQVVTIDFIGPFPRSKKGNKHLLVIQDKFTKWVEHVALKDATSAALKKTLRERIFCRFGWPEVIITDNGSQFISKCFKKYLKENCVRHQLTPIYSPQCNSTERVNRVIKTMIKQYVKDDHRVWDENLPELQFAINTAVQDSTGFSAAQLNFGRDPRIANAVYEILGASINTNCESPGDFCIRMKETIESVKQNMAKASVIQAKYYNLRRDRWQPQVGELVYKRNFPQSNAANAFAAKLSPLFSGPLRVFNYISPTVIELKSDDRKNKKVYRVHLKDIKRIRQDSQAPVDTTVSVDLS